jgi:hypothetical protein
MALRIFEETIAGEALIALHGWLSVAEVAEFEKAAAATGRPPRIDLAHLNGVDKEGLRALQRLRQQGARLTGASPYIELLLERTGEAVDGEREK